MQRDEKEPIHPQGTPPLGSSNLSVSDNGVPFPTLETFFYTEASNNNDQEMEVLQCNIDKENTFPSKSSPQRTDTLAESSAPTGLSTFVTDLIDHATGSVDQPSNDQQTTDLHETLVIPASSEVSSSEQAAEIVGRGDFNGTPEPQSFATPTTVTDDNDFAPFTATRRRKRVAVKTVLGDLARGKTVVKDQVPKSTLPRSTRSIAQSKTLLKSPHKSKGKTPQPKQPKPQIPSKTPTKFSAKEMWRGAPTEPLEGGWPKGWVKQIVQRQRGATAGTNDAYWYSPKENKKFRSMKEVRSFLGHLDACNGDESEAWKLFKHKK